MISYLKKLWNKKENKVIQEDKKTTSDSGDFLTSMAVAQVTDSSLMGYAAGGDITGAIIGESLNDTTDCSSDDLSDSCDSFDSSDSSSDW